MRWSGRIALGLAGSYLLDQEVGHRALWSRTKPAIQEYAGGPGALNDTAVLVTAGFNSRPEATAEPLGEVFSQVGRVALFNDSESGLNLNDNFEAVAAWAKATKTKNLVLYGPSMGSMLNVAIAPRLVHDEGLNVFMLLDSSPYSYADIKGAGRRATLTTLSRLYRAHFRGGPATRFALEVLGYGLDNAGSGFHPLASVAHAAQKAKTGDVQSNAQCLGRADHIRRANLDGFMAALQSAPFVYIGPEDPGNDTVVDTETAHRAYQAVHREILTRITHPEAAHACPGSHPEAYRQMARQALTTFGLRR